MTYTVYHAELGIYLNLSEPDLGHPQYPGLWDAMRSDTRQPTERGLLCPQCLESSPHCPEAMVLVEKRDGRRFARHHNTNIADHDTTNESDQHKAFKERIATAAERGGYTAEVEDRAEDGRRRTDVLVKGDQELVIGWEVQLSYASLASVKKRTQIAQDAGITPSWMVLDDTREFVNKVPWTLTNDMSWKDISKGRRLPIRGGVRLLEFYTCDWGTSLDCPVKKNGRCFERHPAWRAIEGKGAFEFFQLDDLVQRTAAGEYVSVVVPGQHRKNRWWVRTADRDRFLDAGGKLLGEQSAKRKPRADHPTEIRRRPLDPTCRYGEDTGYRSAPAVSQDDDLVVSTVTASTERLCCGDRAPSVAGTPLKPYCQLCPNSPTYWRLAHRFAENKPCPACGLVRCAVGQRDDPIGGHDA
jgi:hypothetical protein